MVAIGLRPAGLGRVAGPKEVPACGQQGIGGCDKDTGRLRHDEARTATETAVATKRQLRSENSPSEPASLSASQSTTPRPSRSCRQLHRWARRPCDLSHRCGIISGVTSWGFASPQTLVTLAHPVLLLTLGGPRHSYPGTPN